MTQPAMHLHHRIDPAEPIASGDDFGEAYRFGTFTATPAARDLSCNGEPIDLGSRAFDLLIVLLRSQGDIVSKQEIFRYVWPSTTVDESNLRFQMATLRKALGRQRDWIKTIPGRGYLFVTGDPSERPAERRAPAPQKPAGDRPAIVIIDRDPENREALQRLLRPFHALVQAFGSFEAFAQSQAWQLAEHRPPCSVDRAIETALCTDKADARYPSCAVQLVVVAF